MSHEGKKEEHGDRLRQAALDQRTIGGGRGRVEGREEGRVEGRERIRLERRAEGRAEGKSGKGGI